MFLIGIHADSGRSSNTKQKRESVKSLSVESKKQSQQPKKLVPSLTNGINIGGISIGIAEFKREKNIALVLFVFRCISEDEFPMRFTLRITDDGGNEYSADFTHYPFILLPLIGSTWITDPPVIVKIPKIARISKFELIPEGKFNIVNLDYQNLTPLPPLSLKFRIEPDQILTEKEIIQGKNLSIRIGGVKIEETGIKKSSKKTVTVNIPVIIENRDYNPLEVDIRLSLRVQLNTGRILYEYESLTIKRTIKGLSKQTFERSFELKVEKDEYIQFILALSREHLGFIYISKRDIIFPEITLSGSSARKPVPPHVEDGDSFPDGSKIVLSEGVVEAIRKVEGRQVITLIEGEGRRIFIMNRDGTGKKQMTRVGSSTVEHVAPLVSPDGEKIAFIEDIGASYSLYVLDKDGCNMRKITPTWQWGSLAYAWVSNDKIALWRGKSATSAPDIDIFYLEGEIYLWDINTEDVIKKLKNPPPSLLVGKFIATSVEKALVIDLQRKMQRVNGGSK